MSHDATRHHFRPVKYRFLICCRPMQFPWCSREALCIRRILCRHVTIGTPMVIFCCFYCLLTVVDTLLVHGWYSLGKHVTIGTPIVSFCCFYCLLTVFDCI